MADDLTPDHTHLRADLEQEALEAAYGAEIGKLFGVLVDGLVPPEDGPPPDETELAGRFRKGLAVVRRAWDVATKELS